MLNTALFRRHERSISMWTHLETCSSKEHQHGQDFAGLSLSACSNNEESGRVGSAPISNEMDVATMSMTKGICNWNNKEQPQQVGATTNWISPFP